ncbi:DNA phosphorothioation-dependent restriction protein DptG [Halonatronum saccharophilum]|uniref:DNA phosphorothioation-dependent restriction protein DptG n=1 Tax=Halonatronum saccharophilum TaxID=150060 RepID=UPI000485FA40|nr:DNA phosphorothioation-dependent restriction protein DptG [Halonatronum saccharophilum]
MARWNKYINDFYYPENTSADAPEKILYFFIRKGLCSNIEDVGIARGKEDEWRKIFEEIEFESNIKGLKNDFIDHYLIRLQQGRKGVFPVPFHVDIPSTFRPYSSKSGRNMTNKGFSSKFLLTFFYNGQGINYELIQKLWDVLANEEGLNYYERFLLEGVRKLKNGTEMYKLKSKETIEKELNKKIDKFKCKYQTKQFQRDLKYILDLSLPRVEKINWIQNLMYFHLSTYMLRIFYIIKKEEEDFLNADMDYCSRCKGLNECPFKSRVITKSSLTGNNREFKFIKQEYKMLMNDVLIKGYYRFIAFNQLIETYKNLNNGKEPENSRDISKLYKERQKEFIAVTYRRLSSYDKLIELVDLEDFSLDSVDNNIFNIIYEIYKRYYEVKGSRSANNATIQVYNKLAGDKMGCNYLRSGGRGDNYYRLDTEFLSFITNIIIGSEHQQMLLEDFWNELQIRGFTYSSKREKESIEKQLSLLGHLDRKSDAGESQYVKKTIG